MQCGQEGEWAVLSLASKRRSSTYPHLRNKSKKEKRKACYICHSSSTSYHPSSPKSNSFPSCHKTRKLYQAENLLLDSFTQQKTSGKRGTIIWELEELEYDREVGWKSLRNTRLLKVITSFFSAFPCLHARTYRMPRVITAASPHFLLASAPVLLLPLLITISHFCYSSIEISTAWR